MHYFVPVVLKINTTRVKKAYPALYLTNILVVKTYSFCAYLDRENVNESLKIREISGNVISKNLWPP